MDGTWKYARIGIPGEWQEGTEEQVKSAALGEVVYGYGLDRGDMFLVAPDGTVLVPADRSRGTTIPGWVPAGPELITEAREADWQWPVTFPQEHLEAGAK